MIADRGLIVVATGSMSEKNPANEYIITNDLDNQFDAYSIIVIEKVENESELRLYDVISFVNDKGINVIHRIIGFSINEEGKLAYETRGDSNNASDAYHPTIDDVQGKYVGKKIPMIGVFVLFMQSSIGIITVVSLIYCLLMIDHFTNKILKAQNERLDHLSQAIDYQTETELGTMKAHFTETIYYKGISYTFNEDGFINKEEIKDEDILEKSSSSIIQVVENNDTNEITSKEFPIEVNEEGKEG
jgi:signal peptidase I